jgi:hypothetical protein
VEDKQVRNAKDDNGNALLGLNEMVLNWVLRIPPVIVMYRSLHDVILILVLYMRVDNKTLFDIGWTVAFGLRGLPLGFAATAFMATFSRSRAMRCIGVLTGGILFIAEIWYMQQFTGSYAEH